MRSTSIALVCAVWLCIGGVVAQYDDFEYGYDEYYDEYNYGNWYNADYDEEIQPYYDDAGYGQEGGYDGEYEGDGYGYYAYDGLYDYPEDYYMDYDYFDQAPDCEVDDKGKVQLLGLEACDIKIEGGNAVVNKLDGGIDGTYKVIGCHAGRPLYKRSNEKKPEEDRLLWYSALYKDWDFNEGGVVVESDILGYGGDGLGEERPSFVPKDKWNLLADYSSKSTDEMQDFVPVDLKITCADGKEIQRPERTEAADASLSHPYLTDEEWEAKYVQIFSKYQKKSEPKINTVFVAFIVLSGIGIVLGIPYMMYFKKNPKSKAYSLLNNGRKQLAGHKH
eukprot:CAMPEP_0117677416 /NCGR_PEP_ID=MMETSP0804-20121206/16733_1 /TAXON_ID=1074897 /ORGANISM="Tetraselmis astigmatica, Strain CCMP880" /LENGTH=333 /DNA_ID=CAMNT_0005486697 /DNA_START=142 /DNA_END=1143 /DNA_ORIENTATION=-